VCAIDTAISSGKFVNLLDNMSGLDRWAAINAARDNNNRHVLKTYPVPGTGIGIGYLANKDGQLEFAFTMQDGVEKMLRLVDGRWEPCPVDLDEIDVITCGDKPGQLVVMGPRQEGRPRALQLVEALRAGWARSCCRTRATISTATASRMAGSIAIRCPT
jgi:hypothetical protein